MTLAEAILPGIIQGLSMFILVSSSSHLDLSQHWLAASGSPLPSPETLKMIFFNVVVHLGPMVSVVVVLYQPLDRLIPGRSVIWRCRVVGGPCGTSFISNIHLKLVMFGLITTAVTGVLGLGVRAFGTDVFATPWIVAILLLITGAILWWTGSVKHTWRGAAQMTVVAAVVIGLAQAFALLPGLSRSGLTIAAALALGMHPKRFRYLIPRVVLPGPGKRTRSRLLSRQWSVRQRCGACSNCPTEDTSGSLRSLWASWPW